MDLFYLPAIKWICLCGCSVDFIDCATIRHSYLAIKMTYFSETMHANLRCARCVDSENRYNCNRRTNKRTNEPTSKVKWTKRAKPENANQAQCKRFQSLNYESYMRLFWFLQAITFATTYFPWNVMSTATMSTDCIVKWIFNSMRIRNKGEFYLFQWHVLSQWLFTAWMWTLFMPPNRQLYVLIKFSVRFDWFCLLVLFAFLFVYRRDSKITHVYTYSNASHIRAHAQTHKHNL